MTLARPFLRFLRALRFWGVFCALALPAQALTVTDIAGREVTLSGPAQRIVLGEARHLAVLAMLLPDPAAPVVGWRLDKGLDPETLAAYQARFPAVAQIAPVGAGNRALSVEAVLALAPDLVVLPILDRSAPQMAQPLAQLEAAGVPVVFVDFFTKPMQNSLPSLQILAELTDTRPRAAEFAAFYQAQMAKVTGKISADLARPKVFVQVHAAAQSCCATVGAGVFDDFITAAGGSNLGRDLVPGVMGQVGMESLLAADPDLLLLTGGAHMAARGGLVLGPKVSAEAAKANLAALLAAEGYADLRAVQNGQVLGLWHLFNDSPAHVVLVQLLAKQLHPELFADLDPAATLAEFERRFAPVALPATWWVQ